MKTHQKVNNCPVCNRRSSSVIPSKVYYWSNDLKLDLERQYYRNLQRVKCRFEMRSLGLWWPFSNVTEKLCPFSYCAYRHRNSTSRRKDLSPRQQLNPLLPTLLDLVFAQLKLSTIEENYALAWVISDSFIADYYSGPLIGRGKTHDFDFFNMFYKTYHDVLDNLST